MKKNCLCNFDSGAVGIRKEDDLNKLVGEALINQTIMPALLIECAFCDSENDMNGYNPESVANAIFKGICNAFDIYSNNDVGFYENQIFYNVAKGDTLCKIAGKFNTTVESLVDLNGIKDRNMIYVGQDIRLS